MGMTQPVYDQPADQYVIVQWTFPEFNDWHNQQGGAGAFSTLVWTVYTSRNVQGPYTKLNDMQWGSSNNTTVDNAYYEPNPIPSTITLASMNLVSSAQFGAYNFNIIPMMKNY
jgi:hypothetical protein